VLADEFNKKNMCILRNINHEQSEGNNYVI